MNVLLNVVPLVALIFAGAYVWVNNGSGDGLIFLATGTVVLAILDCINSENEKKRILTKNRSLY